MATLRPRTHDRPLRNDHRLVANRIAILDRQIAKLQARRDMYATQQQDMRHQLRRRLRVGYLPDTPLLHDILELIDVEPGAVWRWRGGVSNHGVAVVRYHSRTAKSRSGRVARERTAARVIAESLGQLDPDEYGGWYPKRGYDPLDMNPAHRTLRAADQPTGNPDRYDTTKKPESTSPTKRVIRLRA